MSLPEALNDDALFGGRYRPGALLGVGGSASVYQADDLGSGDGGTAPKQVALKVLHPHLCETDSARQAFLAEARRLGQLRHPHIASVLTCGLHDAGGVLMPWIALDLASGPTLAEQVESGGPLPPDLAVLVLDGVLAGLGAAHAAGLVHRDVSPSNVILDGAGQHTALSDRVARLIDFGLADATGRTTIGSDLLLSEQDPSHVRTVIGNLAYLSPEQALGHPVTAAGDLYQAGAVLYFALTAAPPFPRSSAEAVLRAHQSAPPPAPSALQPAARRLDAVVTTAMAKRPENRYPDADAFREALTGAWSRPGRTWADSTSGSAYPATRILATASAESAPRPAPSTPLTSAGRARLDYLAPSATSPRPASGLDAAAPAGSGSSAAGVAVAALAGVAVLAVLSAFTVTSSVARPTPTVAQVSASAVPSLSLSPSPSASPSRSLDVVSVPTLSGQLTAAETTLKASGLRLGRLWRIPSAEAAGTVLSQSPNSGVQVPAGTSVSLQVASGTNAVPDVAGMTVAAAVATVESAGFAVPTSVADPNSVVIGTQPSAGALLRLGVSVTVVLPPSSVAAASPNPTPSGSNSP
jgi:eukaryotic-like serine/threonine-protein kinase